MARIWMSGLEAGHIEIFDAAAWTAISAAQARTGSYSVNLSNDSFSYVRSALPAAIAEVYFRFGFHTDFDTGTRLLCLYDSGGTTQFTLTVQKEIHMFEARRGLFNGTILGRGGEIHQNRWHCVEVRLKVDNAAGVVQVKVDGTLVIDFAGDTQETANADILSFQFGIPGDTLINTYIDDIAFNDISGGANFDWIGRGGIPAIFPIGAGASTDLDLFPNTGEANWEDVDEVPPDDDTSYVFDDLIDDHDSYETDDLPTTGTISAVQWVARAKSDLVGNPEIMRVLRIGGVDYDGAVDIAIDADYDYYPEILDEDPDAGPGAWTVAAVNGMEVGVKVR